MAALFEKTKSREGILDKANKTIMPALGIIAALIALIGSQDVWIKYPSIFISLILTSVVVYPLVLSFFKCLRQKIFPRRLTGDQRNRLRMLMKASSDYVSSSHTCSIFYKWESLAQSLKLSDWNRNGYFDVVRHQLYDMCELTGRFHGHEAYMLGKLSMVVRSVAGAAESVYRELHAELSSADVDENVKNRARSDWNECADSFNLWLRDWEKLFKEANHFIGSRCVDYIPRVRQLY